MSAEEAMPASGSSAPVSASALASGAGIARGEGTRGDTPRGLVEGPDEGLFGLAGGTDPEGIGLSEGTGADVPASSLQVVFVSSSSEGARRG